MTNGEAVIAKLISEIADLTKANGILHGIVSNREEEISGLRAQLSSAQKEIQDISELDLVALNDHWQRRAVVAEAEVASLRPQIQLAIYHQERADAAEAQLASARKALKVTAAMIHGEMIENAVTDMSTMMTLGDVVQSALTDDTGNS